MDAPEERILTNLRKGVLEFCVLAYLQAGRTYGLDLARRLETDRLIASEGTLYPLLARLRSAGMVETEWVESDAGRPRKYYTLTNLGAEYLDAFRSAWAPLRDTVDRTVRRPS
ncbi:PadR family transcriptional regulator [Galbitalea sp. SE-J8]|uniref:PadR family transcriptional regulator n=1 Tax=Galbitalea sp. SE-J8 TaxID=3054952 RepID=UPI00259CFE54|nr:PadR family transcriptional regulator [Galbitalea sp. SE-J8]MDM4764399.1 PadR family transcriptional regulator [Galbitalea sp. SE-J8]